MIVDDVNWVRLGKRIFLWHYHWHRVGILYLNLETYRTIYDAAISYEAKVDSVLKIELWFGSLLDLKICS